MARIQVLPLTTETVGSVSSTPFAIVIDQTDYDRDDVGNRVWTAEIIERVSVQVGARAVLVVEGTLDVANVDEELHRAAQAAVERALCPAT